MPTSPDQSDHAMIPVPRAPIDRSKSTVMSYSPLGAIPLSYLSSWSKLRGCHTDTPYRDDVELLLCLGCASVVVAEFVGAHEAFHAKLVTT